MSLGTREECQDKSKVWDELNKDYNGSKKRNWVKNDLVFVVPDTNALEKIIPPYTVNMNGEMDSPRKGQPDDIGRTWRKVEIQGRGLSSGKPETVFAGRVWDH